MLEVRRGDVATGRSRRLLVLLTGVGALVTAGAVLMVTDRWWAAGLVIVLAAAAFAAPGAVLQWNWDRARACTHCGSRAARRDGDPGELDHRRRYIPGYTRTPVALRCGECGHRSTARLARPYWGA